MNADYLYTAPELLEYEIIIGSRYYAAGVKSIKPFPEEKSFKGDLFLDEIIKKNVKRWEPSIRNPFNVARKTLRETIPRIKDLEVKLYHETFNDFIDEVNCKLKKQKQAVISIRQANYFFRRLYEFYKENPGQFYYAV